MHETKRRGEDLWKTEALFYCCKVTSLQLKKFMDSCSVQCYHPCKRGEIALSGSSAALGLLPKHTALLSLQALAAEEIFM